LQARAFSYGFVPLPVVEIGDVGEGAVGLGQGVVHLEGLEGGLPGLGEGLPWGQVSPGADDGVGFGDPGVGQGVPGVELDGRAEEAERFFEVVLAALVVEIDPLHVAFVGSDAQRVAPQEGFLEQGELQGLDDLLGDVVLDGEEAGLFAVEDPGPELAAVADVVDPGRDPEIVSGHLDAPLEDGLDAEFAADVREVRGLSLEEEGRGPGRDPEAVDVGQGIDQRLRDAVAEVLVVLGRAQIDEGQDGDRAPDGDGARGVRPRAEEQEGGRGDQGDGQGRDEEPRGAGTAGPRDRGGRRPGLLERRAEALDELDPVPDAELLVDVVDVVLDGMVRNEEPGGDLFVGPAFNEQADDLALAGRDPVLFLAEREGTAVFQAQWGLADGTPEQPCKESHPDLDFIQAAKERKLRKL
jgi:hypothetical protein